jgi:Holliday junction resolvase RusA-like endonuclease
MSIKIIIPGRLPGTNEIIAAAKKGKRKYQPYADMKEQYTNTIAWLAVKLPKYKKVNITITWFEPNKKRDPDNIMGGQKFIFDGLKMAGVIKDDSQKYIGVIKHHFETNKDNPHIEVELEAV